MRINRHILLPTPATREYLETQFSAVSAEIDWDSVYLVVGSTVQAVPVPNTESVYAAMPGDLGIWYDSQSARSWIILPLWGSRKMAQRHQQIGDAWDRPFLPHLILSDQFNNRHRSKALLNSVATGLINSSRQLNFHGELVLNVDEKLPPLFEFYQDARVKGGLSNMIFADEDRGIA